MSKDPLVIWVNPDEFELCQTKPIIMSEHNELLNGMPRQIAALAARTDHCCLALTPATPPAAQVQGELWAVHAEGPDDLYAAFSREDAERHANELNAIKVPDGISISAVVIPSPWGAVEHWQYLAEQEREHVEAMRAALSAPPAAEVPETLKTMRYHAHKIWCRVEHGTEEYEAGRTGLGCMEDAAESALYLRNKLDDMLSAAPTPPASGQQQAVVMPERKSWDGMRPSAENMKADAWNACLDKFLRLNPNLQPAAPSQGE